MTRIQSLDSSLSYEKRWDATVTPYKVIVAEALTVMGSIAHAHAVHTRDNTLVNQ